MKPILAYKRYDVAVYQCPRCWRIAKGTPQTAEQLINEHMKEPCN
ncbi:hypothetical protein [Rothia amarae]